MNASDKQEATKIWKAATLRVQIRLAQETMGKDLSGSSSSRLLSYVCRDLTIEQVRAIVARETR